MMRLFHGTGESAAREILKTGLLPRGELKSKGNWEKCPSRPDLVYLTNAYAPYFAAMAEKGKERWAVIEVDVENVASRHLLPDEDFLEQSTRGWEKKGHHAPVGMSVIKRTLWYRKRLHQYPEHAIHSLKGLGTCAYQGIIFPHEIRRVVLFDPQHAPILTSMAIDPLISILNFRHMGEKYRNLTKWFAGYDVEPGLLIDPWFSMVMTPQDARLYLNRLSFEVVNKKAREILFQTS